jgi:hypothetical protein
MLFEQADRLVVRTYGAVHSLFLTSFLPYAFLPPIPAQARAPVMTRREA